MQYAIKTRISYMNFMVVGGGFEPPKAEPSDLQSDPFDHSGTPPFFFWSRYPDSNGGHSHYK